MKTEYTKEYFIAKFEAIPDELWCTNTYTSLTNPNCHCAFGHCGFTNYNTDSDEGLALRDLFLKNNMGVPDVNDGDDEDIQGSTPKERILNALKSIV